MKKTTLLLLSISLNFFISCDDTEKKQVEKPAKKTAKQAASKKSSNKDVTSKTVSNYLQDVNTLKEVKKPIRSFLAEADQIAKQKISFGKDNIEEVFKIAKNYKYLVLVVEKHTIIKITNLDKCIASGSWKTCMPYGEGFIKRNSVLSYKKDYCNNIIGIPDTQTRIAYLFN
jgi:hypothetical protein